MKAIQAEIAVLQGVHDRGVQYGTGYHVYTVKPSNTGRRLLKMVALVLALALASMWLATILGGLI